VRIPPTEGVLFKNLKGVWYPELFTTNSVHWMNQASEAEMGDLQR
jgi:hypothetical protein